METKRPGDKASMKKRSSNNDVTHSPVPSSPIKRRTRLDLAAGGEGSLQDSIVENLFCNQGKFPEVATRNDYYLALAHAVRDRIMQRWSRTAHTYYKRASRTACSWRWRPISIIWCRLYPRRNSDRA